MRRRAGIYAAIVSTMLAGCHRPYFMTEADYVYYNKISGDFSTRQRTDDIDYVAQNPPPNITDFGQQELWALSLQEVIQLALQGNKRIAVLGYQPGEAGTQIDSQLAAFDAQLEFGGQWSRSEQQVSSFIQTGGIQRDAFIQNAFGASAGGFGRNVTTGGATDGGIGVRPLGNSLFSLAKRNATGGATFIDYSLDYQRNIPTGFAAVNPAWTGTLSVGMEQPLLQGAGIEFNRARTLIARAGFEQSIKDFDTQVRTLLRDVENAYWQLYFSYQEVYSREVGLEQGFRIWQTTVDKLDVGAGNRADVAQARQQLESFTGALIDSQNQLLTNERELRRLLGMPPADGRRIIPKDKPTEAQYLPSWHVAVNEAMQLRPELSSQRLVIRQAELELSRQKNGLLPDLTLTGSYGITGLDNQLDQSFNRLFSNKYNQWQLGFRFARPLGERAAHAAVNNAQLALLRQQAQMRDLEHEINHELERAYRELFRSFAKIEIQRQARRAAEEQLLTRNAEYEVGRANADILIRAQAAHADALRDEAQAVVQYNQALVSWEFAKGTILMNDNVSLAEEISCHVPDNVRLRVQRELCNSIPYSIHKGEFPHIDCPEAENTTPLYPMGEGTIVMPGDPQPPMPMEPQPSGTPTGTPDNVPVEPKKELKPILKETETKSASATETNPSELYGEIYPTPRSAIDLPKINSSSGSRRVERPVRRPVLDNEWTPAPKSSTEFKEDSTWKPTELPQRSTSRQANRDSVMPDIE